MIDHIGAAFIVSVIAVFGGIAIGVFVVLACGGNQ